MGLTALEGPAFGFPVFVWSFDCGYKELPLEIDGGVLTRPEIKRLVQAVVLERGIFLGICDGQVVILGLFILKDLHLFDWSLCQIKRD